MNEVDQMKLTSGPSANPELRTGDVQDVVASFCEKQAAQPEPMYVPNAQTGELSEVIRQVLAPVMNSIAEVLSRTNEAMERIAAAQSAQSERLAALEREVKLNKLVTPTLVRHINDEIRISAQTILAAYKVEDAAAARKLGNAIRRSVAAHFGIGALRELPQCEYQGAMSLVKNWMSPVTVREIVKEARERAKEAENGSVPADDPDHGVSGGQAVPGAGAEPNV